MIKKLSLIIFFIISILPFALSQNSDIKDSTIVYYYYQKDFLSDTINLNIIDTSLNDFQKYDVLSGKRKFYASLGNIGHASRNLVFENNNSFGFDFGIDTYNPYLLDNESFKYYKPLLPFTNAFYSQGGKNENKEQNLRVIHSQQIRPGLTISIKGNVIQSFGEYKNSKAKNTNSGLAISYFTKNKKYGIIGNFIHNSIINSENGGIKYDSIFEENIETDRKLLAVNLDDADNRYINNSYYFNQYYKFNKHRDSLSKLRKAHLTSKIYHSFKYNNQLLKFTDDAPGVSFYPAIIKDSLNTYDKHKIKSIENKLSFKNSFESVNAISISLSLNLEHKFVELSEYFDSDNFKSKYFVQYIPSTELSVFIPITKTLINGELKYLIGDYNDKDFSINTEIKQYLGKKHNYFNFKLNYSNQEVSYFYKTYSSNHYQWTNYFDKIGSMTADLSFKSKIIETGIEYNNINNFVYLNYEGVPAQTNKKLSVLKAYLYNEFNIKKFNFSNSIVYQDISEKDILRLPELLAKISLSFNQNFFKGNLVTQTGVDINYSSSYYANSYSPALSSFYLQNEKEINDYVYIDVFLNFKIRRTRFFIKYQHVNQGMFDYDYYSVPHYPLQDRILKYGLSWNFFN